jgi:hypothetical protein
MNRVLAIILIGLIALGNSFSHAHDECHADQGAGVAHVHWSITCSHESKGSASHAHEEGHIHESSHGHAHSHADSDVPMEECPLAGAACNAERTLDSSVAAVAQGLSEGDGNIGCSSCDHLIWVPNYTSFIKENHDSVGHAVCKQDHFTQYFEADCRTAACDIDKRFRPRYTIPIYLRHSALLI